MLYGRIAGLSLRLEHRHDDGSWAALERAPHDPADHDPERSWGRGQVFACTTCDEQVRIGLPDDEPAVGTGLGE
jgi:hypothetical protein